MYFTKSFVTSALLGLAAATTHLGESASGASAASTVVAASETVLASSASSAAAAAASGGTVATHVITVGGTNGTTIFSPDNIVANAGDLVQFQFNPKNHSVVQSTFDQPCVPIQNVMPNKTDAFFSGFKPSNLTAIQAGNVLTYTIRVMDAKPIWFYCSQAKHCQAGMVGAVNAPSSGNKTLAAFKALAALAIENISPGGAINGGGSAASSGAAGAATSAAGTGGVGGASATAGTGATSSSANSPAQATVNAAPGLVSQSFLNFGLGGLAAFMLL
ncbi:Cupredoxin [Lophiostoma macrostomum CBS 122681]|uniref:Cupredoxin n=1 Tax=Lophiostoma macrostomum CBS 122681 TaxID=1314788 RepID=A0A6A6TDW1_9PLEO|nr:Cupredoxin [Lophiostoma macrostomum CBS 122681]